MYRTPFHYVCYYGNNKIIFLFLNSEQLVCFANRKLDQNIQSTHEYCGFSIGTKSYDILKYKNINLDVVREKKI